jgi:hypothetical protein
MCCVIYPVVEMEKPRHTPSLSLILGELPQDSGDHGWPGVHSFPMKCLDPASDHPHSRSAFPAGVLLEGSDRQKK